MESMHPRALSAIHPQGAFHEWNQQVDRHKNQKNTAFRQDYSAWRRRQALARRLPLRKKGLAGQMEKRLQEIAGENERLAGKVANSRL